MTPLSYLGAVLWICGAALHLRTFHELGRFFRFEISIQENHKLIVTCPYVRLCTPFCLFGDADGERWLASVERSSSWVRECG